jgi:hypothetical protein
MAAFANWMARISDWRMTMSLPVTVSDARAMTNSACLSTVRKRGDGTLSQNRPVLSMIPARNLNLLFQDISPFFIVYRKQKQDT